MKYQAQQTMPCLAFLLSEMSKENQEVIQDLRYLLLNDLLQDY